MADLFNFEILGTIDPKKWNNELEKNENATFFQTAEYMMSDEPEKFPLFIYIYDDDNKIIGQLALTIIKSQKAYSNSFLKKYIKLISKLGKRGSWVSGPIIHTTNTDLRKKVIQTLIKILDSIIQKYNLMLIDGYTPVQDNIDKDYKNEFKKNGYKIKTFVTFRTDLSKEIQSIWKNVKKNARNDVTKAKRHNVITKEIQNINDLKDYHLLIKKWAVTKGIHVSKPFVGVEKDWKTHQAGIEKFFLAYQNNELISGLRVGCFNGIMHTNQVLNSYSKAGSLGGPALTWFAIEWAKKNGLRIYDFSGVEVPSIRNRTGLANYKAKWGGDEFPYYHFLKVTDPKKYKFFRLLSKPDWLYREYKKKKFVRPIKQ